ncbi:MAG: hypothetical protein JEZ00_19565 [Anaerolineaceae bacterium]|nr:hypothetical protein [Anaerolineaceae bacterium]
MKKKLRIQTSLILILFVVFLSGCDNNYANSNNATDISNNIRNSSSSTLIPTEVIKPTIIPTTTEESSNNNEDFFDIVQYNVPISDEALNGINLFGQVIYSYIIKDEDIGLLYDLQTEEEYILTDHPVGMDNIQVSPNSKWMFYVPYQNDPGIENYILLKNLLSNENQIIEGINGRLWGNEIWLNDDEIFVPNNAIYNVLNHSERLINNSFPGFDYYHVAMYTFIPVIDPTGTYVVYSTLSDNSSEYVLYNMETEKIIDQYPVSSIYDVKEPEWSNDGTRFFYINRTTDFHMTINIVMKSGELTQIADLEDEISSFTVGQKIWSPNDKYIAFQVLHYTPIGEIPKYDLFIIDVENRKVIQTGMLLSSNSTVGSPIFWSPDSSQLIMENKINDNENEIILLDLATMHSGIIMRNANLHGWISVPDLSVYKPYTDIADEPTPTTTLVNIGLPSFVLPMDENEINLKYASSISEALSSDAYLVTREQVLSGSLINEAKTRESTFFYYNSIIPAEIHISSINNELDWFVQLDDLETYYKKSYMSPCKVVSVYRLSSNSIDGNGEKVVIIQAWKSNDGIKYLQYVLSTDGIDIKKFDRAKVITPYFDNGNMVPEKEKYSNMPDSETPIDVLSLKYSKDIFSLIDVWIKSGEISDLLGYYPLEPIIPYDYVN